MFVYPMATSLEFRGQACGNEIVKHVDFHVPYHFGLRIWFCRLTHVSLVCVLLWRPWSNLVKRWMRNKCWFCLLQGFCLLYLMCLLFILVTERTVAFFTTAISSHMKRKVISIETNVPTSKVGSGSQFVLTPCKKTSTLSASNWDLRCSWLQSCWKFLRPGYYGGN